jgi:hypothetical protein
MKSVRERKKEIGRERIGERKIEGDRITESERGTKRITERERENGIERIRERKIEGEIITERERSKENHRETTE